MSSTEGGKKRKRGAEDGVEGGSNAVASSSRPALPPIVGHDDEPVSTTSHTTSSAKRKERKTGSVEKTEKKKKAPITPGIVYISRLPPGMTPQKVRHLMGRWGEVGKVYAQPRGSSTAKDKNHKPKHTAANYSEAWVEFLDKSVAKMAARLLNAQVIGGKPGDKWREDIWTMKYLSGFRWEMLGEQVAYERQAHQSRLRAEIAKSRTEQSEYLRNVELARVLDKRKARKGAAAAVPADAGEPKGKEAEEGRERKKYKQRQVVDQGHGLEAKGMDSVLGSVFG